MADTAPQTTDDYDSSMLSRTGVIGPYGLQDHEIATKVDVELFHTFNRMCHEQGTDRASVLRNWINEYVRGQSYDDAVKHAMERRARALPFKGAIRTPTERGEGCRFDAIVETKASHG